MAKNESLVDKKYWPFDVLPFNEQSKQHQDEIAFLKAAYQEGFSPYICDAGDLGASYGNRGALILVRGRSRWEIVLWDLNRKIPSSFQTDFPRAGNTVLEWLRGSIT